MRTKITAVMAALAAACVLVPTPASATHRKQFVGGRVFVATGPRRAGAVFADACGLSGAMLGWVLGRADLVEYRFPVAPATRGRRFVLSPSEVADLEIMFRGAYSAWSVDREGLGEPERGIVPHDAVSASVCLVAGAPTGFRYRAG